MSSASSKIRDLEGTVAEVARLRAEGKKVVQCHGCFDVVHPGHVRYLRFARSHGDALLVSVSADRAVRKGADRPYFSDGLRMENLAAFEFVDMVTLVEEDTAEQALHALKPDIYVKGREYEVLTDPRFVREKDIVESYGGQVVYGSGDVVFSSSEVIRRHGKTFEFEHTRLKDYCGRYEITPQVLESSFDRAAQCSVLVVGDPILDHYIDCTQTRVASEGPILTVTPTSEEWFAGGAALIALTLRTMGVDVTFITTPSEDEGFERFRTLVESAGVTLKTVAARPRPTFVKRRYLVGETKLLKVDQGRLTPLAAMESSALADMVRTELLEHDALLCSDFGYGLFSIPLAQQTGQMARQAGAKYFVDVSTNGQANLLKFEGASLAAPTEEELRFALADKEAGLSNLAGRYYDQTGAGGLVVTMGDRGAIAFEREEGQARLAAAYLPAFEQRAADPVGAGDLFLSGLVMGELAGVPRPVSMYQGACLAAIGCQTVGNRPVERSTVDRYIQQRPELMRA